MDASRTTFGKNGKRTWIIPVRTDAKMIEMAGVRYLEFTLSIGFGKRPSAAIA